MRAAGSRRIAAGTVAAAVAALLLAVPGIHPAAARTPAAVSAAASVSTAGAIEVVWTTVDDAVGYLVVPQRLTSAGTWAAIDGRTQRVTVSRPLVFDGLVNGTSYRACVAAVLPDGFVTSVSEPAVPYGLPGVPVLGEITREGDQMTVTWSPAPANGRAVTSYTVTVVPATIEERVVGGSQTSIVLEGLDPEVDYTVSVRATNLRGQGEPSEVEAAVIESSAVLPSDTPVIRASAVTGPCGEQVRTTTSPSPGGSGSGGDGSTSPDDGSTSQEGDGDESSGSTTPGTEGAAPPAEEPGPSAPTSDDAASSAAPAPDRPAGRVPGGAPSGSDPAGEPDAPDTPEGDTSTVPPAGPPGAEVPPAGEQEAAAPPPETISGTEAPSRSNGLIVAVVVMALVGAGAFGLLRSRASGSSAAS